LLGEKGRLLAQDEKGGATAKGEQGSSPMVYLNCEGKTELTLLNDGGFPGPVICSEKKTKKGGFVKGRPNKVILVKSDSQWPDGPG